MGMLRHDKIGQIHIYSTSCFEECVWNSFMLAKTMLNKKRNEACNEMLW